MKCIIKFVDKALAVSQKADKHEGKLKVDDAEAKSYGQIGILIYDIINL